MEKQISDDEWMGPSLSLIYRVIGDTKSIMSVPLPVPPVNLPLPPPPMIGGGGGGGGLLPSMGNNLPLPPLPLPLPPGGAGGGGGGGVMPFTNTVLITSAPRFLHSFHAVREWLYPCGSTRTVIFYPRPKRKNVQAEENDPKTIKNEDDNDDIMALPKKITILITMGHPDAAIKFLASFKEFSRRLDERYNDIDAFMVPNSPDVPLCWVKSCGKILSVWKHPL
jgi:hypothetical protein